MALKLKITKEAFDKLPADIKTEYKESGGEYVLDVDGLEDTGALKRAKDREAEERRAAVKERDELKKKLDELDTSDARKRGDIDALEKSWSEKHTKETGELSKRLQSLQDTARNGLMDATASAIASKISTVPALMSKAVRERLSVEFVDDRPSLRILDKDGKPSALTVDDLSKEFLTNKDFAPILIGTKASGSGAPGNGQQRGRLFGSAENSSETKPKDLSKMDPHDFAASIKASKEAEQQ